MHLKIITILLVISSGCIPWFSTPKMVYKKLPSVWERDYSVIEYSKDEWITKFWGQEAIGVPEAKFYMRELTKEGFFFSKSSITLIKSDPSHENKIITTPNQSIQKYGCVRPNPNEALLQDTYKDANKHGIYTGSLITGKTETAISSRTKITETINIDSKHKWLNEGDNVFSSVTSILITDSLLKITGSPKIKTISVSDTGNSFPQPISGLRTGMVTVGSIDPSGWIGKFSQASKRVAVLAPGLQEFNDYNAVSLVSGALAEVKSILPTLTQNDALHLLQKTAINTTINEVSNLNKATTLNLYKMLRVAKRLADAGFPANRHNLLLSATYSFKLEATELAEEAKNLITSGNKSEYRSGFKKLRIAFFLNPDDTIIRDRLAKIYRDGRHNTQAMFYADPAKLLRHEDMIPKIIYRAQRKSDFRLFKFIQKIGDWEKVINPEETLLSSRSLDILLTLVRKYTEDKIRSNPANMDYIPKSLAEYIEIIGKNIGVDTVNESDQLRLLALMIKYAQNTKPYLLKDQKIADIIMKHQQKLNVIAINDIERIPVYAKDSLSEKRVAILLKNLKCYPNLGENKILEKFVTDRDELIEDATKMPIHDLVEKIVKAI